jgi:MFS family permease
MKITKTYFSKNTAIKFIILLGIVSLFADMTYESARSIAGPYLAILGANAAIVGFVAGFGEMIGYGLRVISGYIADRTKQYWTITIIGYICNLVAVPLLALAHQWWIAAALMIIERMGKAIRTPARDAMLSHAGQKIGMGWGFGLHEALDQTGAMVGPLIIAAVFYFEGGYSLAFAILSIPAILALTTLAFARWVYPHPEQLEIEQYNLEAKKLSKPFWIYFAGASLVAAGYADFPLMAYHFHKVSSFSSTWIPILYSLAMGVNTISAPLLGRLYDRKGFIILIAVTLISSIFAPLVFLGNIELLVIGIILWGIGMGAHESLMRAIVANMTSKNKRASAYGIFNMGYGIAWFLGSVVMGVLYDISIPLLVIFSIGIQLLAIPILWVVRNSRVEGR